jgi:hypothetical protein
MNRLLAFILMLASVVGLHAADTRSPLKGLPADYDSELRRPNGRVDVDAMVRRLQELGVGTYYWLIWHAPTDWDDLKVFLPKARQVGLEVWVYLVPPSEGSGSAGPPSQPFGLDFLRWAEEIARLSLEHTNLTGWVIDDFYANHETLAPAYVGQMQSRAKRINPRLAFLPLMYFNEFRQRHGDPASPERISDGLRMSLQAWRDGRCDGVVTYCLDKSPQSTTFPFAQNLFREFRKGPP